MCSALPMHTLNTLLLLPVAVDVVFLLDSFDLLLSQECLLAEQHPFTCFSILRSVVIVV